MDPRLDLGWRLVVAVLTGLVLALVAPPVNLWWLHPVAFVPVLLLFRGPEHPNDPWILGYAYGVGAQGAIYSWIAATIDLFSDLPSVAVWGVMVIAALAFGIPYLFTFGFVPRFRRWFGSAWPLAFAAMQLVVEYLSMQIILFPYQQGVSFYRQPALWSAISLTGVAGLTFLILWTNGVIAELVYARREGRPLDLRGPSAVLVAWAAMAAYGTWHHGRVEAALQAGDTLRLGQIQTSKQMLTRMGSPCEDYEWWKDQTAALPPGSVDLVVWPEGGSVYPLNRRLRPQPKTKKPGVCYHPEKPAEEIGALARDGGFEILVGSIASERRRDRDGKVRPRSYNSVYHLTSDGELRGRYDKLVPLPFGEYLPFSDWFPQIKDWVSGPGDFGAGEAPIVFDGEHARYATPICYEGILPAVCNRFADPDVLVNGTLDAWFGDTAAPHQHAMLMTARAVELGIPVVRSAWSGTSMVVEPHGRIVAEAPPFVETNRIVTMRIAKITTPYKVLARYGLHDWLTFASAIGLLVGVLRARRRRLLP